MIGPEWMLIDDILLADEINYWGSTWDCSFVLVTAFPTKAEAAQDNGSDIMLRTKHIYGVVSLPVVWSEGGWLLSGLSSIRTGCWAGDVAATRTASRIRWVRYPIFMSTTTWTGFGLSSSSDSAHPTYAAPSLALDACTICVCLNIYGWTIDSILRYGMQVDLVSCIYSSYSSFSSSSVFGI